MVKRQNKMKTTPTTKERILAEMMKRDGCRKHEPNEGVCESCDNRDWLSQKLDELEGEVRKDERYRIKNECKYCQGMGTVRESVENEYGLGEIQDFDCERCRGKGFIG